MKQLNLNGQIQSALEQLACENFTVDDLTEAYLSEKACVHSSKKAARQFVYRTMVRLIKRNELEKLAVDQGWPLYRLTKHFSVRKAPPVAVVQPSTNEADIVKSASVQNLKERLNRHKLEMLSAMGEAEEYDSICAEMPEMRAEVQARYNDSRDRCSKLLGRVKALENLLSARPG